MTLIKFQRQLWVRSQGRGSAPRGGVQTGHRYINVHIDVSLTPRIRVSITESLRSLFDKYLLYNASYTADWLWLKNSVNTAEY